MFYTHSPRAFRSTLIGHLYELCQHFPTVLLAEALDDETEAVLHRRDLFPKLEAIVPVRQFTGPPMPVVAKNRYLCQTARDAIDRYRPEVVVSASDMHSLFELYLFRFARRAGARTVTFQAGAEPDDPQLSARVVDLTNAHSRMPHWLPAAARVPLIRGRKWAGHLLYHWILPVLVGQPPFAGPSSYLLRRGNSGMRDADYHIVLSPRDLRSCLRAGVPANKLRILSHPWTRPPRRCFEAAYLSELPMAGAGTQPRRVLAILPGEELGFRRSNWRLISREERRQQWIEIIELIQIALPGWVVRVKPHPDARDISTLAAKLERVSPLVQLVDPASPVDREIALGDVIVGLPRASSTALLTAALQRPEAPVIAIDLFDEVLGDVFKSGEGIEYVTTTEELIRLLESIRGGAYKKPTRHHAPQAPSGEFASAAEAVTRLRGESP